MSSSRMSRLSTRDGSPLQKRVRASSFGSRRSPIFVFKFLKQINFCQYLTGLNFLKKASKKAEYAKRFKFELS